MSAPQTRWHGTNLLGNFPLSPRAKDSNNCIFLPTSSSPPLSNSPTMNDPPSPSTLPLLFPKHVHRQGRISGNRAQASANGATMRRLCAPAIPRRMPPRAVAAVAVCGAEGFAGWSESNLTRHRQSRGPIR